MRTLASAKATAIESAEALHTQTGLAETDLEPPGDLDLPESVDEAIRIARDTRGDIKAVDYRSEALFYQRVAKDMQWLPFVDARASYHYDQNTGFADTPLFWRVSAQATWQLWDGGLRLAERREIGSQIRVNDLQERVLIRQAEERLRVAWQNHETASRALASVEEELRLAEENVRLAERSFSVGEATWLDVEQAQLALRTSEFNRLSERMNQYLAAVQIRIAAGTL
jgi:outer membrane protein TolC